MKKRDLGNVIFELTALEGSNFDRFIVNRWGDDQRIVTWFGQKDKRKKKSIYLYVKVVGLVDKNAPVRNWGKFSKGKNEN